MEDGPGEDPLAALIASREFARLSQSFQSSTGVSMQAFDLAQQAYGPIQHYPRYCRILQEHKLCPLFFDRSFLQRSRDEIAVCCAGVGHLVIPINRDSQGQIGALVSQPVRFAPNAVQPLVELAFRLKVFPDDLIQAADSLPPVERERLIRSAHRISYGLALRAEGEPGEKVDLAVKRLLLELARCDSPMLCEYVARVALQIAGGDYAGVLVTDDSGTSLGWGFELPDSDRSIGARRRLLEGVAEWVNHTGRPISIAELQGSSWSRHLTEGQLDRGSLVGVPIPIPDRGDTFGAIVVGFEVERDDLQDRVDSLERFVEEASYAILLGRRLIETKQES